MKLEKRIILNILESLNEKVVSKKQLVNAFKDVLQVNYLDKIIANLRRSNDILYVFKGYYYVLDAHEKQGSFNSYSTTEMAYVVLNKVNIRWHLGLESALERNNLIWQGVVNPIILNSKISVKKKILGITYQFHKIKKKNYLVLDTLEKQRKIELPFIIQILKKPI